MKKVLCSILLIAAAAMVTGAGAVPSSDVDAPAVAASGPVIDFHPGNAPLAASAVVASDLPSCWNYDGNYCPVPSTTVRCQWQPYEPGFCRCSSSNTWVCG